MNVRDNILPDNVNDGVPAQYVYEAADCRLYWNIDMLFDMPTTWAAVANATGNGAQCTAGAGFSKWEVPPVSAAEREVAATYVQTLKKRSAAPELAVRTPKSLTWYAKHVAKVPRYFQTPTIYVPSL